MFIALQKLVLAIVVLCLSGCVSWMTSEPAGSNVKGIRYSLPQPFLLVVPKADGTMSVETVSLPDPTKTYALRQNSIMAAHALDVILENGMLKTVALNADTTAVAKETISAIGEIQKAQVDAEIAAAKAQADASKATQQKVVDAKAGLDKATTLRIYLEEYLNQHPSDETAKVELLKANMAEQQAQADYIAAKNAAEAAGIPLDDSGFNDPTNQLAGGPLAFTPMLYRVEQNGNTVNLVSVKIGKSGNGQESVPTSTLALPQAPTPPKFAISPDEVIVVPPARLLELTANQAVKSYDASSSSFRRVRADGTAATLTQLPTVVLQGLKMQIALPNNLTAGNYTFVMALSTNEKGTDPKVTDLKILVR